MDQLLFHPKIVHIPVALGVLMPLIAFGVLLAWWRGWVQPRVWLGAVILQAVLVGSGLVAMQTGEAEEEQVERVVAESHIEHHEEAAEAFVWTGAGVLGLMILGLAVPGRRLRLLLAGTAALGTVVVLGLGYRTGEAGGRLVYEHGAAQVYTGARGTTPAPVHDDD